MGEEPEGSGVSDGGLTGSGGAHEFRSARSPSGAFPPEAAGTADSTIRVDSPRGVDAFGLASRGSEGVAPLQPAPQRPSPSGSIFEPTSSGSVFEPKTPKVSSSGGSSGSVWGDDPLGLSKPTQVRSTSETRPSSTLRRPGRVRARRPGRVRGRKLGRVRRRRPGRGRPLVPARSGVMTRSGCRRRRPPSRSRHRLRVRCGAMIRSACRSRR